MPGLILGSVTTWLSIRIAIVSVHQRRASRRGIDEHGRGDFHRDHPLVGDVVIHRVHGRDVGLRDERGADSVATARYFARFGPGRTRALLHDGREERSQRECFRRVERCGRCRSGGVASAAQRPPRPRCTGSPRAAVRMSLTEYCAWARAVPLDKLFETDSKLCSPLIGRAAADQRRWHRLVPEPRRIRATRRPRGLVRFSCRRRPLDREASSARRTFGWSRPVGSTRSGARRVTCRRPRGVELVAEGPDHVGQRGKERAELGAGGCEPGVPRHSRVEIHAQSPRR